MELAFGSIIVGICMPILVIIIGKWWDPIAEYLGYPLDVGRRVGDLVDAIKQLSEIDEDLRRLDPQPSSAQCKGWLQRVQDLTIKAKKVKIGFDGCRLNYFNKCYYGRAADRKLKKANDLLTEGKYLLQEARARPRSGRNSLPQHPQDRLWGMDSYKKKADAFIEYKGKQPQPLGIWGMGGVGKTSLLKLVRDSYADCARFDHILFVQAGKECTVGKVQQAIATSMGLPLLRNETSQEDIIFNNLKDKSFLLLLDDVWGFLDLNAVGIPMPLGEVYVPRWNDLVLELQRKVIVTTRSLDVCGKMGCANNIIRMECLSEDDAWNLFTCKAGSGIISDTRILPFAKEIAEECSGLPRALCTIGQAMSTKKNPKEWRDAINLLKKSKLHGITADMNEDLFGSLKFSYDYMENNLKDCFLICSLWPEDENIPKEKLIWWWAGLGFLDMCHVSNAADRGYSIINCLVRSSMLEKGDTGLYSTEKSHVKMHGMIRKMAQWTLIRQGDQDKWLPHSIYKSHLLEEKWCIVEKAWISQADAAGWSPSICLPKLTMLVTRHAFSPQVNPSFQNITILDLEGTKRKIFPSEVCELANLQHLNLSATEIDALPMELKNLPYLKYLYLRDTGALQTIPKGLILLLKKLQWLDLFRAGTNSPNVQYLSSLLKDLASPTINLSMLGITVQTIEDLGLLDRVHTQALCMHHFKDENNLQIIDLGLLHNLEKLLELVIMNSSVSQRELVAEGEGPSLFPDLEILEFCNLLNLEKVTWKNAGLSITEVGIYNCNKLRDVTWVQHLRYLEQLTIENCKEMERLISNAELGVATNQMAIIFPRLQMLYLKELPELSIISEQDCQFEELSYIRVAHCEKLVLKISLVQQRNNQDMVKIDCNEVWWTSLVQSKEIMAPTFCL